MCVCVCVFLVACNGPSPVYQRSLLLRSRVHKCVCMFILCDLLIREILSGHGPCTPQWAVMKSLLTGQRDSTETVRQHSTTQRWHTHTIRLGMVNVNRAKALTS